MLPPRGLLSEPNTAQFKKMKTQFRPRNNKFKTSKIKKQKVVKELRASQSCGFSHQKSCFHPPCSHPLQTLTHSWLTPGPFRDSILGHEMVRTEQKLSFQANIQFDILSTLFRSFKLGCRLGVTFQSFARLSAFLTNVSSFQP